MDTVRIMNGQNNEDNSNTVDLTLRLGCPLDLTLRLGLPWPYKYDQNTSPLDDHNDNSNTLQGMDQLGMVNQGSMVQGNRGFNGIQYAPSLNHMASNINHLNYANAFNQISGPAIRFPYCNTYFTPNGFRGRHYHLLPAMSPVPMNTYTLIDVPRRRMMAPRSQQQELGLALTLAPPSGVGFHSVNEDQLHDQHHIRYLDHRRRCTNYNCNTNDTPMWRKGPLGPKTLCNACGIKYRKEVERREAARQASRNRIIQEN